MAFLKYKLWLAFTAVATTSSSCAHRAVDRPSPGYVRFSELVHFPDFYPGLGTLYVQPTTLPYGPFRGYNREGNLVNTIFMVPLQAFDSHATIRNLQGMPRPVDHVEIYFNGGHPGVEMPHYHIVLWHVSSQQQERLK